MSTRTHFIAAYVNGKPWAACRMTGASEFTEQVSGTTCKRCRKLLAKNLDRQDSAERAVYAGRYAKGGVP